MSLVSLEYCNPCRCKYYQYCPHFSFSVGCFLPCQSYCWSYFLVLQQLMLLTLLTLLSKSTTLLWLHRRTTALVPLRLRCRRLERLNSRSQDRLGQPTVASVTSQRRPEVPVTSFRLPSYGRCHSITPSQGPCQGTVRVGRANVRPVRSSVISSSFHVSCWTRTAPGTSSTHRKRKRERERKFHRHHG